MQTQNIQLDIDEAIHNRNASDLYDIAEALVKQGDEEGAHELRTIIKEWNREDWAYDEAIGN